MEVSALTEIKYKLRLQTWQNNACCKKTLIKDLTFHMPSLISLLQNALFRHVCIILLELK